MADTLLPDWPAPRNVRALQTLRSDGCSQVPWNSFNLGDHVGDAADHVAANRTALRRLLPREPLWLKQVHGIVAVNADSNPDFVAADAAYSRAKDHVCVVMTAGCLPLLLCDQAGSVVAAAHAGWRGLLDGIIEQTVAGMAVPPATLIAWLGPAIGPACFEVGEEVRTAFMAKSAEAASAFIEHGEGKWLADIYQLARQRLNRLGIFDISGGNACTVSEPERYFSYRRDGITGRMASLIWLADEVSGV